jgi:hypothetical protein
MLDWRATHDRRRPGGLKAPHLRGGADRPISHPGGGDVAGVADREGVHRRGATEGFRHLPGDGLLARDPERVDRVDEGDTVGGGEFLDRSKSGIE